MLLVPSSGRTSLDCRAWTADLMFLLLPGTWHAGCLEYLLPPDRWEVISAPSLFPESSATFPKFAFNPDDLQLPDLLSSGPAAVCTLTQRGFLLKPLVTWKAHTLATSFQSIKAYLKCSSVSGDMTGDVGTGSIPQLWA